MLSALALLFTIPFQQEGSTLRQDLEEVRALIATEDGAGSLARMEQLLADHAGTEEIKLHMGSVQREMTQALFLVDRAERAKPSSGDAAPPTPFSAQVESYKEKGGKYKLRWETEEELEDFQFDQEGFRFPVDLDSRFRFTLELEAYPEDDQIKFLLENLEGRRLEVECGLDREGMHRQALRVYSVVGDKRELLLREDKKLPVPGKKVDLSIEGKGSSVQLFMGKKRFATFKPGKAALGFLSVSGLERNRLLGVVYHGSLNPEQVGDLKEENRRRQLLRFRARVNLHEYMPSWSHAHLSAARMALEDYVPPGIGEEEEIPELWESVQQMLDWTRPRLHPILTLSHIQEVDEEQEGWNQMWNEYTSMIVAFEGGYWDYAYGHANNVLQHHPQHSVSRNVQIEASARMDYNGDDTWELATNRFLENPEDPSPILHATLLLMDLGMADDVPAYLEEGKLPEDLVARCNAILQLQEGPQGSKMKEKTFPRIAMKTDVGRDAAEEVGDWIAREVGRAASFLPEGTIHKDEPLNIYLFADRWDYEEFAFELLPTANPSAAGFYCGQLDAVVAWLHPVTEIFHDSLRRETMIHVGKRIHHEYPVWGGVGLAAIVADRSLRPDMDLETLSPEAMRMVKVCLNEELIPMTVMLRMTDRLYYTLETDRDMASQAWALSFILMVIGDAMDYDAMDALINGPRTGLSWTESVDALLDRTEGGGNLDRAYHFVIGEMAKLKVK
ncbi:MAG: hypothetical protein ACPG31_00380 [Planctomycetota bacterium]